jgi:hypothetical protein
VPGIKEVLLVVVATVTSIPASAQASLLVDPTGPSWRAEGNREFFGFGSSVGSAGDVNGDGFDDLLVGSNDLFPGSTGQGRAFAFHGSSMGLTIRPTWIGDSAQSGATVGTAGDVNGDGFDDVILGARTDSNGQSAEGRAFVYHGSVSGLASTPEWTAESDQAFARFGISVGTAGDVNGDGYHDVIVGAYTYTNDQEAEGRAFVYRGSASGLATTPAWTAEGDQEGGFFGISVGTAGDVNGDGFSDVIVGAHGFDNGQSEEGRAFAYHGSSSGLSTTPAWTAESDQTSSDFGWPVGTAGDVNGDGFDDAIVGAADFTNDDPSEGRAFVYHGSSSGLASSPSWTAEGDQGDCDFAQSVGAAGDVNGDGFDDVIVGARHFDHGQNDEGVAWIYHGSGSGLLTTPSRRTEGGQESAEFGWSVSSAGDVNGDGYDEVVIGAPSYDHDQPGEGIVLVYRGQAMG